MSLSRSNFYRIIMNAFLSTYVKDNHADPAVAGYDDYQMHPLTLAFAFLGFSTRPIDGAEEVRSYLGNQAYVNGGHYKQSWTNIFKNLFGWQSKAPFGKKVINGFLAPFAFIFNIALAVLKCAINILKLVTEFLPLVFAGSFVAIERNIPNYDIWDAYNGDSALIEIAKYNMAETARFFAKIGRYFSYLVHFIGRAITSPIQNAQDAYAAGKRIGGEGVVGKILGVVLTGISVIISLGFYTLAAPIALNFGATALSIDLATKLPTFLHIVGNFLQPAVTAIYGAASGIPMAYVGLSALVAAAMNTIGHGVSKLRDLIVGEWYKPVSERASILYGINNPTIHVVNRVLRDKDIRNGYDNTAPVQPPQNASGRVDGEPPENVRSKPPQSVVNHSQVSGTLFNDAKETSGRTTTTIKLYNTDDESEKSYHSDDTDDESEKSYDSNNSSPSRQNSF